MRYSTWQRLLIPVLLVSSLIASSVRPMTAAPNEGWSTYASPLKSITSI